MKIDHGQVAGHPTSTSTVIQAGTSGTFTVTTFGSPQATLSVSGTLPPGITFTDNGNGTATIAGTAPTTPGVYPITITARNRVSPTVKQVLLLYVGTQPAITSAASAQMVVATAGSFTVATTGYPAATVTESGALPTGVTFTSNGDGTATLAGTPASGTQGAYTLTLTASNGLSPVTQTFTLTATTS